MVKSFDIFVIHWVTFPNANIRKLPVLVNTYVKNPPQWLAEVFKKELDLGKMEL